MSFRWNLALALALIAAPAFAQQQRSAKSAPAPAAGGAAGSIQQKASYSFGMMIGSNLKKQGVDVDINLFIQGLRDSTSGGKLLLTEQEAGEAIAAFEKEMHAKKAAEGKQFLARNKERQGVQSTATGLQYQIVKPGNGAKPTKNDAVTVIYKGMFINGEEFDSSSGKPFTIGVADVIPGWQEALQLMPAGSKWRLFIPSELAYGEVGQPPIGPNATLVFDLELVEIAKAPPAAGALRTKPNAEQIK